MKIQTDFTTIGGLAADNVYVSLRKLSFDFKKNEAQLEVSIKVVDDDGTPDIKGIQKVFTITDPAFTNNVYPALRGEGDTVFQRIRAYLKNQIGGSDLDPEEDVPPV